jgi:branched-chain amino acid transport system substrate-binding protein
MLLAALTFGLPGCSLLVNFEECSADTECGDGVCTDGICEVAPGPASCTKGSDCGSAANTYCFSGLCRVVNADKCQVQGKVFESASDALIVPIGGLMPLTGSEDDKGIGTIAGAQLALEQINAQGGLAQGKFGLVVCDTKYEATRAKDNAQLMYDDLGIQAFIGAISSSETLEVANQVAIPNNLLVISPASTSPAISGLNDKNLIWRTIASDSLQAPAMAKLVKTNGFTKIALLSVDNAYGEGFKSALQDYWATNEPTLLTDASRYKSIQFSAVDFTGQIASLGDELFGANGFKPDAIIVIGATSTLELIANLESVYISKLPAAERPVWVGSEALKDPKYLEARFTDVWPRAIGTVIKQASSPLYVQYGADYQSTFKKPAADYPFSDKAYDAAYLIALAYAAQAAPLKATGVELSQVLGRVSMGTAAEAKATKFSETATTLSMGGSVNFSGVSGPLDFDGKGDVFGDIASWSITPGADTKGAFVDGAVIP